MSEPASIVIIEDDADINEVVAVHLRRNGFACTQAFSGSEGRLLLSGSEPFDLVFLDPPYALPASCALGVPRALAERGALAADAIVVYEHAASTCADADEAVDASGLALARRKKYGDTVVDVLRATALHDAID